MKPSVLYQLIKDKSALDEVSTSDLQNIILQYPYFQTAKVLLLKKMKLDESLAFNRELKKAAVYIADRAKLYAFLNPVEILSTGGHEGGQLFNTDDKRSSQQENSFTVSSGDTFDYLFLPPEEEADNIPQEIVLGGDYFEETELVSEQENSPQWGLIDDFVNNAQTKIQVSKDFDAPQVNLTSAVVTDKPIILTETLAKIYIKQKKYAKAIGIFENLSLKIPEKSAYFADRIDELKILIKNS